MFIETLIISYYLKLLVRIFLERGKFMKTFGIVSYNIYCNFTNYGSALQSWALIQIIDKLGKDKWQAKLIDYCPDILMDKNPLDPIKNMLDVDQESRRMCELSMPAIKENYCKFNHFYNNQIKKTIKKYTSYNFNDVVTDENIDGFICGSDTIFCIDEFNGFDDGYYGNYDCMKNGYTVAYAASFGDAHFNDKDYLILKNRLKNFKAIGLRESTMISYVRDNTVVPLQKVIDPTLLLKSDDYDKIVAPKINKSKYLLLYARRYNPKMSAYAEKIAESNGWEIIEISLRATNAQKHKMFYEAGVEEFLSLVKHAEFIVTNSFHGIIFSIQYKKQFASFSRDQCDNKIVELMDLFGLRDKIKVTGEERNFEVDYDTVYKRIEAARIDSLNFLELELEGCK